MNIEDFVTRYPTVYHMAEAGAWPTIRHAGLLSTTALLDLFGVNGERRERIESARRDQIVEVEHPSHGRAAIRDNKPLREKFLERCLDGMSTRQWYELLNRKTFFWVSEDRLNKLLGARAYRKRAHEVITFDTRLLVARYESAMTLASMNTGATLYPSAPRRGADTFQRIGEFDFVEAAKRRGRADAVVELTVDYAVHNVEELAVRVEHRAPESEPELLWQRQ